MAKVNKDSLSLEEKLELALIPIGEQPYEVPDNWCWIKNNIVCQLGDGVKSEGPELPYLEVKYLRGVKEAEVLSKGKLIESGTKVILVDGENSGEVFDIFETGYMGSTFKTLVISSGVYDKYLLYFIHSKKDLLRNNKTGSAIPHLNKKLFFDLDFPLPPLAEQQRIVEQIESLFAKLDEAKEQVQSVLGNSEERKSALLFKAYSGALTKGWREQNGKSQEEWQEVCLKDVCKINPPKINAKDYDDDLEVSFFPMPALSEVTGTITEPQTRKLGEVKTGFTNFTEGDVVFAKITPCMENGKSAIIGKLVNGIGYGTTEFYVMRCSNRLLNGYLYHLVRSKHFRDEAKSVMTGAVGQQRVPKSFLEEYKLKLPTIEEQAEILRIVEGMVCREHQVVANCENVIEQIDIMKKSILARAFHGELGTNGPDEESSLKLLKQIIAENL